MTIISLKFETDGNLAFFGNPAYVVGALVFLENFQGVVYRVPVHDNVFHEYFLEFEIVNNFVYNLVMKIIIITSLNQGKIEPFAILKPLFIAIACPFSDSLTQYAKYFSYFFIISAFPSIELPSMIITVEPSPSLLQLLFP